MKGKDAFLQELKKALPNSVDQESILNEYKVHIEEKLLEGEEERKIILEFGAPEDIAASYQDNIAVTQNFVQRNFILCNCLFFFIGALLTIGYHLFQSDLITSAWHLLMNVPFVIIVIYTAFWLFLGYEIGKEYGFRGSNLLAKTVLMSLVPNLALMLLTLFEVIPTLWFAPILSPSFVIICVIMTLLFYPISRIGYRIGIYFCI